jgi:ribonuclease P protein component
MLKKENRLKKEAEVKLVFSKGRSVFDSVCGFKYQRNGLNKSRFAIMVGTKISKSAVKRNCIRRQVSEILRLNKEKIKVGYDFTFIARPEALGASYQEIEKRILGGLEKAGMVNFTN